MQNQEKIIQAIAANIQKALTVAHQKHFPHDSVENYYLIVATELAAAIAPHLEAGAGWDDAPDWAEWRARDKYGAINYFEAEPAAGEEEWYYGGKYEQCGEIPYWTNTLERRPR